jgi:sodium/hydrogen antiporter
VDDRFCTCHGHAIGAVIEPTDPVLASDIQTLPPQQDDSLNAQIALTTEAGLNDGLVFPFPTFPLP